MKQIKFNGDFYFLISKKENLTIQTINECNKLIIEEPENPFLSKFETNYGINDICFCPFLYFMQSKSEKDSLK